MREIENLVFEGGGVLGQAYSGAIAAMHEKGILDNVKRVAGTSAGAVAALLVTLKYSAPEIKEIIGSTDFKQFEDHKDPIRLPLKYGLYKGEFLLNWIKKIVSEKTGNGEITYGELHAAGYRELKVYACDLNATSIQEFSFQKTPNVKVAESIRASMSIPLFFSAWKFPDKQPSDHIYVDGGTIYNYPINAFDPEKTLGFFFRTHKTGKGEQAHEDLQYNHIIQYIEMLFRAILDAQKVNFLKNKEEVDITVFIDTMGISPTNFNLSKEDLDTLFNSGKQATKEYIERHS